MSSLSARKVEATKPDPKKTLRISDGEGLYLKVAPSGTKTFVFRYTYAGRERQEMTLGTYPTLGLAEAREERLAQAKILAAGRDPLLERRAARQVKRESKTVSELIEDFYENWLKLRYEQPEEARATLKRDIGRQLGKQLVVDVSKQDITRVITAVTRRGKVAANRLLTLTKKLFQYAVDQHMIEETPATMTKSAAGGRERSKMTTLSWGQIVDFMEVLESREHRMSWQVRRALLLILATCKRPGEVASLEWKHLNLEKGEWLNPAALTKEKRADHMVFLSPFAVRVLRECQAVSGRGRFVFPSPKEDKRPITVRSMSQAVRDLHAAGIITVKFTPHDLRRTFRTRMSDLKQPRHVLEKCMDHLMEGVEAVYNLADYFDERREAMDIWGAKLEELQKQVPMPQAKRRKSVVPESSL